MRLFKYAVVAFPVAVLLAGCDMPARHSLAPTQDAYDSAIPVRWKQKQHMVYAGDSLYSIAWQYAVDPVDLAKLNNMSPPYTLQEGRLLLLPKRRHTVTHASITEPVIQHNKPHVDLAQTKTQWLHPVYGARVVAGNIADKGINFESTKALPVKAVSAGKVVYAGKAIKGYGTVVLLQHGPHLMSAYGHNGQLRVHEGQRVKKGQVLSRMAKSGQKTYRLHFELRQGGQVLALLPHRGRLSRV